MVKVYDCQYLLVMYYFDKSVYNDKNSVIFKFKLVAPK